MALSKNTEALMQNLKARLTASEATLPPTPATEAPLHTKVVQGILDNITTLATLDISFDPEEPKLTSPDPRLNKILEEAQQGRIYNRKKTLRELLAIKNILADQYQLNMGETKPNHVVMARRTKAFEQALSAQRPTSGVSAKSGLELKH